MKPSNHEDESSGNNRRIAQFASDLLNNNGHPVEEYHVLLSERPDQSTVDGSIKAAGILAMIEVFCPQHRSRLRKILDKEIGKSK